MRIVQAVLFASLAACTGSAQHIQFQPLPELVANVPPSNPIVVRELGLIPGERMIWDVQAKGFSIARAEMTVGDGEVNSRVETNALAAAFSSLSHEMHTVIDGETALPRSSSETFSMDGETTKTDAAYTANAFSIDGRAVAVKNVHDLHTLIGAIRAWAQLDSHAGYLDALVGNEVYRIEVNQPMASEVIGKQALRVDCRVLPPDRSKHPFTVSMWLATTSDRTPLRFEVASDKGRIAADLVERTEAH